MKLRKLFAGRYEYRGRSISRIGHDGPRGGTRYVWEVGGWADGVPVVDGLDVHQTLAAAIASIDLAERKANPVSDQHE